MSFYDDPFSVGNTFHFFGTINFTFTATGNVNHKLATTFSGNDIYAK